MANSEDPDQTAPIGAVYSGSTPVACILNSSVFYRQLFAADDFNRRHFQMHFSWRFIFHVSFNTPGRRQSKTSILSRNVDQRSLETEFLIAICCPIGDLLTFDPRSLIV